MTSVQAIGLQTPRLRLRHWLPADRAPFAALNADPAVMAHFPALGNRRSRAVMKCIGMVDGQEDFIHPALPAGHPLGPHCLYRLSRARWASLNGPAP